MGHDTAFSPRARVLMCENCGAPMQATIAAGFHQCAFCHAQNRIVGRNKTLVAPEGVAPISEKERLSRLRAQCGRPKLFPPSLDQLQEDSNVPEWKMKEALAVWRQTRAEAEATHSADATERLLLLCLLLSNTYSAKGDSVRQRALYESALDVVTLSRHRQVALTSLAIAAITMGDPESAEEWLRPCDPRSDDLEADSQYRFARAAIDGHHGRYDKVVDTLGATNDAVPILHGLVGACAGHRANALEKLGRVPEAVAVLCDAMIEHEGTIAAMVEAGLCKVSYPEAQRVFASSAQRRARDGGRRGGASPILIAAIVLIGGGAVAAPLIIVAMKNESRVNEAREAREARHNPVEPATKEPSREPVTAVAYADSPDTKSVVSGMRAGFRKCVNKGLASQPNLTGDVEVVATIDPSGKVTSTKTTGSLPADVTSCIKKHVDGAVFPATKDGNSATVTIPVKVESK